MNNTNGTILKLAVVINILLCGSNRAVIAESDTKLSTVTTQTLTRQEAEVKAQMDNFSEALASAQAKAVADLWTADGSYINRDGLVFTGHDALEKRFANVFLITGKISVSIIPEQFKVLSPNVVSSEGLIGSPASADTRYSMVWVKQNGKWLIANATETPLILNSPKTSQLSALDWLIGDWKAENNGGKVHMKADWAQNKKFILCRYEIDKPGQEQQITSQVIGWDPRTKEIISWSFDASGGYGYGHWSKKMDNWIVASNGVTQNGKSVHALNIISINDPNNFSWQSVDRHADGVVLDDTEPLKVQRLIK